MTAGDSRNTFLRSALEAIRQAAGPPQYVSIDILRIHHSICKESGRITALCRCNANAIHSLTPPVCRGYDEVGCDMCDATEMWIAVTEGL